MARISTLQRLSFRLRHPRLLTDDLESFLALPRLRLLCLESPHCFACSHRLVTRFRAAGVLCHFSDGLADEVLPMPMEPGACRDKLAAHLKAYRTLLTRL